MVLMAHCGEGYIYYPCLITGDPKRHGGSKWIANRWIIEVFAAGTETQTEDEVFLGYL